MISRGIVSAIFAITVLTTPSLCAQESTVRPPRSGEELAERYRQAHMRKDIQAITRLFYWGASTDKTRMLVRSFITHDVAHDILGVSVKPLDPKDLTEYTQEGVRYRMTLPATAKLVIDFQPRSERGGRVNSEQTSYFIGVRNGEYWFVTAEPSGDGSRRVRSIFLSPARHEKAAVRFADWRGTSRGCRPWTTLIIPPLGP
jgi:hypothetical protein